MHYKHLHHAFLFEFVVGLLTIYFVFAVGSKGMAVVALLALRPLVLDILPGPTEERLWRMYYKAAKWGLLLTGATIVITYLFFNYLTAGFHDRGIVFLTIIPWFMIIHGFIGFILTWPERQATS